MSFLFLATMLASLQLIQCAPASASTASTTGIAIMQCKAPANSSFQDRTELWITDDLTSSMDRKKSIVAYHGSPADDAQLIDISAAHVSFPEMIYFSQLSHSVTTIPAGSVVIANGVMIVKPGAGAILSGKVVAGNGASFAGESVQGNNLASVNFLCTFVKKVDSMPLSTASFPA